MNTLAEIQGNITDRGEKHWRWQWCSFCWHCAHRDLLFLGRQDDQDCTTGEYGGNGCATDGLGWIVVASILIWIFMMITLYCFLQGRTSKTNRNYVKIDNGNGLYFDMNDECIYQITFSVDYGFDFDASTQRERENNVHEADIKMSKRLLCTFNNVVRRECI